MGAGGGGALPCTALLLSRLLHPQLPPHALQGGWVRGWVAAWVEVGVQAGSWAGLELLLEQLGLSRCCCLAGKHGRACCAVLHPRTHRAMQGDFAPADLLCPKSKCWVPLERVRPALDQVRARGTTALQWNACRLQDCRALPLGCHLTVISLSGCSACLSPSSWSVQAGMVAISEVPGALEGLGAEHLVDPSTHTPSCPPRQVGSCGVWFMLEATQWRWLVVALQARQASLLFASPTRCLLQPTQAELDSCKLLIAVGRASGGPQAQVVTLG